MSVSCLLKDVAMIYFMLWFVAKLDDSELLIRFVAIAMICTLFDAYFSVFLFLGKEYVHKPGLQRTAHRVVRGE